MTTTAGKRPRYRGPDVKFTRQRPPRPAAVRAAGDPVADPRDDAHLTDGRVRAALRRRADAILAEPAIRAPSG